MGASNSFQLIRENAGEPWRMFANESAVDQAQLETYFQNFTGKIFAESFAAANYPGQFEVLQDKTPDITFSVEYFDRDPRAIYLFERPENPNNFFGWVEGENDLVTVQHFVFDKFLVDRGYFQRGI